MKTKYPMRIGSTLYPKDTEVRLATTEEIRKHWSGIKENEASSQVAVVFPAREVPTICNKDQFYAISPTKTSFMLSARQGPFSKLRFGNIIGIVDAYGAVHSEFTGEVVKFHAEFWPNKVHCQWRWNFNQSLYWISNEQKPNEEQYDAITRHIEKKYGIKWWDNGHHDLDHFLQKLNEERT